MPREVVAELETTVTRKLKTPMMRSQILASLTTAKDDLKTRIQHELVYKQANGK